MYFPWIWAWSENFWKIGNDLGWIFPPEMEVHMCDIWKYWHTCPHAKRRSGQNPCPQIFRFIVICPEIEVQIQYQNLVGRGLQPDQHSHDHEYQIRCKTGTGIGGALVPDYVGTGSHHCCSTRSCYSCSTRIMRYQIKLLKSQSD